MSEILKKINKRDYILKKSCVAKSEQLNFLRKYSDSESQVYILAGNYIEFIKEIYTILIHPVDELEDDYEKIETKEISPQLKDDYSPTE